MRKRWYDVFLHIFTHLEGEHVPAEGGNGTIWSCRVCGEWMGSRFTAMVIAAEDDL